jgi:tryptophan-rich sensory protein
MKPIGQFKLNAVLTWSGFYGSTCIAAAGAFWFVGDLNANGWIAPVFAPPAWLFGPVWTTLYLLIATSAYRLVSMGQNRLLGLALGLWCLQMTANTLWTPVFFGAFDLEGALFISCILWLSITSYILVSFRIDRWACYLFVPYWVWVSFATFLNYSFLKFNPST